MPLFLFVFLFWRLGEFAVILHQHSASAARGFLRVGCMPLLDMLDMRSLLEGKEHLDLIQSA